MATLHQSGHAVKRVLSDFRCSTQNSNGLLPDLPEVRQIGILPGVLLDRRIDLDRGRHTLPRDMEIPPARLVTTQVVMEDPRAAKPFRSVQKNSRSFLSLIELVQSE